MVNIKRLNEDKIKNYIMILIGILTVSAVLLIPLGERLTYYVSTRDQLKVIETNQTLIPEVKTNLQNRIAISEAKISHINMSLYSSFLAAMVSCLTLLLYVSEWGRFYTKLEFKMKFAILLSLIFLFLALFLVYVATLYGNYV